MGVSPIRVLSLCTGGAGLDRGLARVEPTARAICYVEVEAFAVALLAAQIEDATLAPAPIWTDLRTFRGRAWRGAVDCIVAGFPCQDISSAGKRAGIRGKRSELWFDVARVIREVRPRIVFLENVDDLIIRGVDVVLGHLAEMGFAAAWGVFSAAEVGAPHLRERWFCLAVADAVRADDRASRSTVVHAGCPERRTAPIGGIDTDGPCKEWTEAADRPRKPGSDLADSDAGRQQPSIQSVHRRESNAEGCGVDLVDAIGSRLERRLVSGGPGRTRGITGAGTTGAALLADADADGCEFERCLVLSDEREETRWDHIDGRERPSISLGQFPPGPTDSEAWHRIVEHDPWLAPAIAQSDLRQLADGMVLADRNDLLRLLGNGVVPQQAEHAYRVLRGRLMQEGLWPL